MPTTQEIATVNEVSEVIRIDAFNLKLEITKDSRRDRVLNAVEKVSEAMGAVDAAGEKLRFVLGQIMAIVQDRELYKPQHRTFEEYRMSVAERYKLSRNTVSRALGIVRALPMLTATDAQKIPEANLYTMAQAVRRAQVKEIELPPPKVKELLKAAQEKPIKEFRAELEKEGMVPARSLPDPGIIIIRATARMRDFWEDYVGEKDPAEVLASLIGYQRARITPKVRRRTKAA